MHREEEVWQYGESYLTSHPIDRTGTLCPAVDQIDPDPLEGYLGAHPGPALFGEGIIIDREPLVEDSQFPHELEQLLDHLSYRSEEAGYLILLYAETLLTRAEKRALFGG